MFETELVLDLLLVHLIVQKLYQVIISAKDSNEFHFPKKSFKAQLNNTMPKAEKNRKI